MKWFRDLFKEEPEVVAHPRFEWNDPNRFKNMYDPEDYKIFEESLTPAPSTTQYGEAVPFDNAKKHSDPKWRIEIYQSTSGRWVWTVSERVDVIDLDEGLFAEPQQTWQEAAYGAAASRELAEKDARKEVAAIKLDIQRRADKIVIEIGEDDE